MKVLLVNGSPHKNGSTYAALHEVETALNNEGIETSIIWLGTEAISGCLACGYCSRNGKCVKNDIVNEFEFDFKSISQVIAFAPSKNDTTEIADIAIPIKSWLGFDGSFTNAEGLTQEFSSVCESENMSIVEIVDKINGELE